MLAVPVISDKSGHDLILKVHLNAVLDGVEEVCLHSEEGTDRVESESQCTQ